jgi:hypothetical protein
MPPSFGHNKIHDPPTNYGEADEPDSRQDLEVNANCQHCKDHGCKTRKKENKKPEPPLRYQQKHEPEGPHKEHDFQHIMLLGLIGRRTQPSFLAILLPKRKPVRFWGTTETSASRHPIAVAPATEVSGYFQPILNVEARLTLRHANYDIGRFEDRPSIHTLVKIKFCDCFARDRGGNDEAGRNLNSYIRRRYSRSNSDNSALEFVSCTDLVHVGWLPPATRSCLVGRRQIIEFSRHHAGGKLQHPPAHLTGRQIH